MCADGAGTTALTRRGTGFDRQISVWPTARGGMDRRGWTVSDDPIRHIEQRLEVLGNEMRALKSDVRDLKSDFYGDKSRHVEGMLEQFAAMRLEIGALREDFAKFLSWRRDITVALRVGVVLLGGQLITTGAANWDKIANLVLSIAGG